MSHTNEDQSKDPSSHGRNARSVSTLSEASDSIFHRSTKMVIPVARIGKVSDTCTFHKRAIAFAMIAEGAKLFMAASAIRVCQVNAILGKSR